MWITPDLTRRSLLKSSLAVGAGQLCLSVAGSRFSGAETLAAASAPQVLPPRAMPSRSDVIMSVRIFRDNGLEALQAFHATRNEWMYSTDAAYVAEMKKIVYHVGLAISPTRRIPGDTGAAKDIDGSVIVAPWMKAVNDHTPWNSIFKADSRASIMKLVNDCIAAGADSIHCDDPEMEYSLVYWGGGDYSPEATAAFQSACKGSSAKGCRDLASDNYDMSSWVRRRMGRTTPIDWNRFRQEHGSEPAWQAWTAFMKSSTAAFLGSIRNYLHSQQRPLPLSMNVMNPLPGPGFTFLFDTTDYLISEIYTLTLPRQMACYNACAAAWQLPFVPSIAPQNTPDTQWGIALGYALGDTPLVPWDTYVPKKPRYYGTVADYGHLFDFVRKNAVHFDGFDEIADLALIVEEATTTKDTIDVPAQKCLDLGASFRFVVLRANGTVTGNHQTAFPPQVAVAAGGPATSAKSLFPSIPTIGLNDLNRNNPALRRILRTITPNPQKIVAVPRINKRTGTFLIHVVDATNSNEALNSSQFMELIVPQSYWPYLKGVQSAVLLRPGADPVKRPLAAAQDAENMTVKIPLEGITGWGILVFDHAAS